MDEEIKLMKLTLGQKFKMLREKAGKTEAEVAAAVKTQVGTYRKIEGDFIYPTESMINKVARLHGLTYQQLLDVGE
jgi:transcriptional regulator with XRE-family HTH domain